MITFENVSANPKSKMLTELILQESDTDHKPVAKAGHLQSWIIGVVLAGMLLFGTIALNSEGVQAYAPLAPSSEFNVSGYEVFPGLDCTIEGEPAMCGVTFGGWTGGDGATEEGWASPPGDRNGRWKATVEYRGKAAFGGIVTLTGGKIQNGPRGKHRFSGTVSGGTVEWPKKEESLGCGTSVAVINASFSMDDGSLMIFEGCLHDLPAGDVIPPKIWGTFSTTP
jgi:hypothetical protein